MHRVTKILMVFVAHAINHRRSLAHNNCKQKYITHDLVYCH